MLQEHVMGNPKLVWRNRQDFCQEMITERAPEEREGEVEAASLSGEEPSAYQVLEMVGGIRLSMKR